MAISLTAIKHTVITGSVGGVNKLRAQFEDSKDHTISRRSTTNKKNVVNNSQNVKFHVTHLYTHNMVTTWVQFKNMNQSKIVCVLV